MEDPDSTHHHPQPGPSHELYAQQTIAGPSHQHHDSTLNPHLQPQQTTAGPIIQHSDSIHNLHQEPHAIISNELSLSNGQPIAGPSQDLGIFSSVQQHQKAETMRKLRKSKQNSEDQQKNAARMRKQRASKKNTIDQRLQLAHLKRAESAAHRRATHPLYTQIISNRKNHTAHVALIHTELPHVFCENTVTVVNVGTMTYQCSACKALMFKEETHHGQMPNNATFSLCCSYGTVRLAPVHPPPDTLKQLFSSSDTNSKHFRQNIRLYNSALALSSIGVDFGSVFNFQTTGPWIYKVNGQMYHSLGPILPASNQKPTFSQLYVYDTEHELDNRHARNTSMDKECLHNLQQLMHEHNPYVHQYKQASQIIQQEPSQNVQLVLKATGTPDPRRFNTPTGNDIAIVLPQDSPQCQFSHRDVVLFKTAADNPQGFTTKRIHELHPMYDPTAYPLFFIFGDMGYDYETQKKHGPTGDTKLSTRKYYRYRFMEHADTFNTMHMGGRLFQQYLADMWCKTEKECLDYIRRNQKKLRAELYQGLADTISSRQNNADVSTPIGTRLILPSTVHGSPRQMHELYQDAMALVRWFGKPELFITFTCNPKWPEIVQKLQPGQCATDRPDVVNRVFYLKLKQFF
jgi:hypothetical protein